MKEKPESLYEQWLGWVADIYGNPTKRPKWGSLIGACMSLVMCFGGVAVFYVNLRGGTVVMAISSLLITLTGVVNLMLFVQRLRN